MKFTTIFFSLLTLSSLSFAQEPVQTTTATTTLTTSSALDKEQELFIENSRPVCQSYYQLLTYELSAKEREKNMKTMTNPGGYMSLLQSYWNQDFAKLDAALDQLAQYQSTSNYILGTDANIFGSLLEMAVINMHSTSKSNVSYGTPEYLESEARLLLSLKNRYASQPNRAKIIAGIISIFEETFNQKIE